MRFWPRLTEIRFNHSPSLVPIKVMGLPTAAELYRDGAHLQAGWQKEH
jgi:hypothetical protein